MSKLLGNARNIRTNPNGVACTSKGRCSTGYRAKLLECSICSVTDKTDADLPTTLELLGGLVDLVDLVNDSTEVNLRVDRGKGLGEPLGCRSAEARDLTEGTTEPLKVRPNVDIEAAARYAQLTRLLPEATAREILAHLSHAWTTAVS